MKTQFEVQYHRLEENHWWFVSRRELVRKLVRRLNPDLTCHLLEIGCSGGLLIRQLQQDGYKHVTGIDISEAAIRQCASCGITGVHLMDAQNPSFPPESFDLITASDVLEHLADAPGALTAWLRLLRPGGRVVVFVPAFMSLWSQHDIVNLHRHRYTARELQNRLSTAGFTTERLGYWNFMLFLPVALVRFLKRIAAPSSTADHGDLSHPPKLLNLLLLGLLRIENRALELGLNFPWGVSVMVIARKPIITK